MCLRPKNNSLNQTAVAAKARFKKSPAIKELERMVLEDDIRKHPLITPQYVARTSFRDDSIKGLIHCILAFLKSSGHQAKQVSNISKRIDNRTTFEDVLGRKRTIGSINRMPLPGNREQSDISATIFKSSVKIKVEIGLFMQCRAHRDYQRAMEMIGVKYVIATSFEQFKSWYDSNFKENTL